MSTNETIFNTKNKEVSKLQIQKENEYIIRIAEQTCFVGDITLELKNNFAIGKNYLASFVFNTAFLADVKSLKVKTDDLSPLSVKKSGTFNHTFQMEIEFKKVCECGNTTNFKDCEKCKCKKDLDL